MLGLVFSRDLIITKIKTNISLICNIILCNNRGVIGNVNMQYTENKRKNSCRCWPTLCSTVLFHSAKSYSNIFTSNWNKLCTTLLNPGMGVSLFTGRMKVFLIDLCGRCSPLKPLECHSETHKHLLKMRTLWHFKWTSITDPLSKL